jgi:hypothetical protein
MTKAERLAAKIQQSKNTIEKERKALAESEAALREETRQATDKRRYQVGALADDAGLLAWSNAELAGLFTTLARLREVKQPGKVLDALLDHVPAGLAVGETGMAEATPRVSATH